MKNLTLAIDEDLLREARKIAVDRNTTVNSLVRDYLTDLVNQHGRRNKALKRLMSWMDQGLYTVGPKTWTRDDLHER